MTRRLIVTADDFGVGPATSRGILDLAAAGVVTSTVLLVNSPHAVECVRLWEQAGKPLELGWHPCLTMDAPVLPSARVPTLVGDGCRFLPLGAFLKRLTFGRVRADEIEAELRAQHERFRELVGHPPPLVNAHHHVHVFRPVGAALMRILGEQPTKPFLRRVVEPWRTLRRVSGVRVKRWVLSTLGKRAALRQAAAGFPGNDELLGVTDPPFVHEPDFFPRWVQNATGEVVELMCHPGYADDALGDRDGPHSAAHSRRRVIELERLLDPSFREAVEAAGFTLTKADV